MVKPVACYHVSGSKMTTPAGKFLPATSIRALSFVSAPTAAPKGFAGTASRQAGRCLMDIICPEKVGLKRGELKADPASNVYSHRLRGHGVDFPGADGRALATS